MKPFIIKNKKILFSIFWILLWQIAYWIVQKEILLVSPFAVITILAQKLTDPGFYYIVLRSLSSIMAGYFMAVVVGTLFSALASRFPFFYDFLYPPISIIKATPVASFIILALVWMKTAFVPPFITFLMVFPIMFTNMVQGFASVDKELLEMAKLYEFSRFQKIKLIYIPTALPYFTAAASVSMGLGWKAGIAAEVISSSTLTIGASLRDSKVYLETGDLFAWTTVIILLSILLEKGLVSGIKKLQHFSSGKEL